MADFVDDDAVSIATNDTYLPGADSPLPDSARVFNPYPHRMRTMPPTSSENGEDPVTDPEAPDSNPDSEIASPVSDRNLVSTPRPLRKAAADGASPMRKHARIDLGYISDIAEMYDTDDEDELEADGVEYAPFDTQAEVAQGDHFPINIPDCEDIGTLDGLESVERNRFVKIARHIQEDGLVPLVDEACIAENSSGSNFGKFFFKEAREFWTEMSLLTLCSMPEKAIRELLFGNLKQAYDSDVEFRDALDSFEERAKKHPCIYTRSLTTADGQLMTITQARRLVKWLQRYVSDDQAIQNHPTCKEAFRRIDSEFGNQWRHASPHAARAYLASKSSPRQDCRVENVRLFCQQLLAECDTCEAENRPLKPLLYIGYAARADRRKRQHEACGKSANWLATLAQAICNVLWGRGQFKMHFMVICLLAEKSQGTIAEMLLTRISGAYYNAGGGFCIDVAGKSMESLHFKELTTNQNLDLWNDCVGWVEQNTPLIANARQQLARHTAFLARQETERRARIRADKECTAANLKSIRDSYMLCQQYKNHHTWQDQEAKDMVQEMEQIWQEVRHAYPDDA
jgi:hypothetical protein